MTTEYNQRKQEKRKTCCATIKEKNNYKTNYNNWKWNTVLPLKMLK